MTEGEWLVSSDPSLMLSHLGENASPRKLRLFAVTCCRDLVPWMERPQRRAVETAERMANGRATAEEVLAIQADVPPAYVEPPQGHLLWYYNDRVRYNLRKAAHLYQLAHACCDIDPREAAMQTAHHARMAVEAAANCGQWPDRTVRDPRSISRKKAQPITEAQIQAAWLRDIFGNPFRPSRVEREWREWHGGLVVRMARGIVAEAAFDRMPILADALEEAGCNDAALLSHCREPAELAGHLRHCWVLDLVLGNA